MFHNEDMTWNSGTDWTYLRVLVNMWRCDASMCSMSVLYKQFYNVQTKIKAKVPHVLGWRQKTHDE